MLRKIILIITLGLVLLFLRISTEGLTANENNQITIISARIASHKADGRNWDIRPQAPDPFVKIFIGGELILESSVKEDTYTPEWNEKVSFSYTKGTSIRIEVLDRDAMSDDLIGKWEDNELPNEELSFGQVTKLNLSVIRK